MVLLVSKSLPGSMVGILLPGVKVLDFRKILSYTSFPVKEHSHFLRQSNQSSCLLQTTQTLTPWTYQRSTCTCNMSEKDYNCKTEFTPSEL